MTNNMQIRPLMPEHVLHVAEYMREKDKKEIYALRFTEEPADLARESMYWGEYAWTVMVKGVPVAVFGLVPQHPGVYLIWLFATDDFQAVAVSFTKFLKRVMIPRWEKEAHRIECKTLSTHTEAHNWMRLLKLERQCTLERYGKNGEDFYLYAWTKKE